MIRAPRLSVPLIAFMLAVSAFSGCSDDESAKPDDCTPIEGDKVTITGTLAGWEPDCLEVKAGRTIDFTAVLEDDEPHNLAVSGPGLSQVKTGAPVRGGQLELRVPLQKAGYYQYICTIHASMESDLYVEE